MYLFIISDLVTKNNYPHLLYFLAKICNIALITLLITNKFITYSFHKVAYVR